LRVFVLETLKDGASIQVDLDELRQYVKEGTTEERRNTLVEMGYEKYFDKLKTQEGFTWL